MNGLADYASESWKQFVGHPGHKDVPVPKATFGLMGKLLADRGLLAAMSGSSGFWARPDEIDRSIEDEVNRSLELYQDRGWIDRPATFHRTPPPLTSPTFEYVRSWWPYEHMRFDSAYEPYAEEPGRDRWLGYRENRTAHAWVLRHAAGNRPWLVTIHGYGMGFPHLDLRGCQAQFIHNQLGMNVLCYVMPLHGPRRTDNMRANRLFTGGVANLVHGEAQAMWDLRRAIHWIREEHGAKVGVHGLSLGGYTTALLATLERDLACVVAGIPAADFIDLFRRHMADTHQDVPEKVETFWRNAEKVLRPVSPLASPPLVERNRRFIFAGLVDRLVPPEIVRALWEHWDHPTIAWYPGSHVSFLFEPKVRRLLSKAFKSSGIAEQRWY